MLPSTSRRTAERSARGRLIRIGLIAIFALVPTVAIISGGPSSVNATDVSKVDTDHDGTVNQADSDIDGDGIPNGVDPDVDGDGINEPKRAWVV